VRINCVANDTEGPKRPDPLLLTIAYIGFISLGLPDAVIGVAWPKVRDSFELPNKALGLAFVASGFAYFLSSFFTGRLLKLVGIGTLLAGSSMLVAASGFGYALAPLWMVFLGCSMLHGFGSGAIDAGLNNFVARHFAARQMNWLHACYMVGATIGPTLMTVVIVLTESWRLGYATIGSIMFLLSLLFLATRGRWGDSDSAEPAASEKLAKPEASSETMLATLRLPAVWLQVAIFFLYTGLEVTVGGWSFTLLTESRGVVPKVAGIFVATYWASLGVGRLLFGWLVEHVSVDGLLRVCTAVSIAGCTLLALPFGGIVPLLGLIAIGLSLAPIYPCLMTRTPQRLGYGYASHAIGFQVSAAMIGAAALPLLAGVLAEDNRLWIIPVFAAGIAMAMLVLHEVLLGLRLGEPAAVESSSRD
jgi:fucose permease